MKNKKFLFTAIAVALSLVFAVGCAKSDSLSVAKKKYDAVITVIDDYVIALEKGKTYLFENGKKVVNDGFKEIKPIAKYSQSQGGTEYVTDGFIVRREGSSEFCILDTSSLNVYSYGSDVVDVKLAVKETGVASYEPCGYLFTHSDGKKSVGNVGTSGQSDKFDSAKFENGYLITNTYAQGGSVSLRDSFFSPFATVEKSANGNITTVTDSTGISYSAVAVVDRGTAVQDVERYVIFGPGGKIDSADSVAVSIGAGYFTYEKGGSKYIINPDYSNTVNNDYQYPLISTPDGKCLILEQNSEGKQRAKELSGGKTTAWFDEIGIEVDDNGFDMTEALGPIITAYSHEKSAFFNAALDTVFEKDGDWDCLVSDGNILVANESEMTAFVDGVAKTRTFSAGEEANVFRNGVVLMSEGDREKVWVPYTDYTVTLKQNTSVTPVGISTGNYPYDEVLPLFYAFIPENANDPVVISANAAKYTTAQNMGSLMSAFGAENFSVDEFRAGRMTFTDMKSKTDYELSSSGVLDFVGNSVITVDYITYAGIDTIIVYGDAKNQKYLYVSSSPEQIGLNMFFKADDRIYSVSRSESGVEITDVMYGISDVSDIQINTDMISGKDYIFADVGGRTAVYDEDGNLVLAPRYNVEEIQGGLVKVSVGEKYGIVSLGKDANKAKLIKNIEYDSAEFVSADAFMLAKEGGLPSIYNKKGKCMEKDVILGDAIITKSYIAKNYINNREMKSNSVLTYTDGRSKIMSVSVKQDDFGVNLFIVVLGMLGLSGM